MRESLYKFSDDELSLRVFNDEYLYLKRHERGFIRLVLSIFQVTNKQKAVLKADLAADKIETKRFNSQNGEL